MLVAESLRRVPEPLEAALPALRLAPPAAVAAAIVLALRPSEAEVEPPSWLRPAQRLAFRRVLAALARHGAALLAEPPGTGKSWIALAAAAVRNTGPTVVVAPAALLPQWRATALRAGVAIVGHSHEATSRGRLPPGHRGLVVVDEAHRFRDPSTRRYRALAPWLVGRHCLLVSATPVVNDPRDLAHLLRLVLRDDALAAAGMRSLREIDGASALEALGDVVVAGTAGCLERPRVDRSAVRVRLDRGQSSLIRGVDRLVLSSDAAIAALIRTSLLGAAASSPAALAASLLRYLALLDQAADAMAAGRRLDRAQLRQFVAGDPAQLVLWEMIPIPDSPGDLVIADRPAVAELRAKAVRAAAGGDAKRRWLAARLRDGRRTLVFTNAVATVDYLWRGLAPEPVAWCTGTRAGIGPTHLPREAVLAWFAPGGDTRSVPGLPVPRVLVTTDVAAEGLDLQGAERVIHYDLPWTAVRGDQRVGRVHRLGSAWSQVAEEWVLPPRTLARRLGTERILARKRALPGQLGLGESSPAPWRRRQEVARALPSEGGIEGVAVIAGEAHPGGAAGAVAAVRIVLPGDRGVTRLFVHDAATGWRADEPGGLALLQELARGAPAARPDLAQVARLQHDLAGPVRIVLREVSGRQWHPGVVSPVAARLLRRLRHWARIAARARDALLLERLDHAVRGLCRGLSAGEEILLGRLAARTDATLQDHLAVLPTVTESIATPVVRLVGMLVVISDR